ncbi:MAG TPA: hypothetical protein VII75_07100 [Thermoanaerobaculia bacterium]
MHLSREGEINRVDFDFHGHAGYAIARREVNLELPANYQFVFRIRGDAPSENLEFKLIDGDNVWWLNRRDFVFPRTFETLRTKKRQIGFAWGPAGGGEIRHVESMEVVITAGSGGKGTVWFSDPELARPPEREFSGLIAEPAPSAIFIDDKRVEDPLIVGKFVWLPDGEGKTIRAEGATQVEVMPPEWAPSENDFYAHVARAAKRGDYPRYLIGEQPYWTVIGADGADNEALIGEDGNIEPFKGGDSIEPFLWVHGKRLTWADVEISQSLAEGDLPIPSVTWKTGDVSMTMTAAVSSSSMLQLRYRITGDAELELKVRPFQVNPSTQFLNTVGGVSRVHDLKGVERRLRDGETEVDVALAKGAVRQSFARIASDWRAKLHRVPVVIGGAPEIANTIRTSLAYTLIHRDGPALEPGSRSYDRAWIRDGALLSAMLIRLGHAREAGEFAHWFAKYQYDDGKVPCCVDRRGADPVPENDSHGELIYLVAETHATDLWPQVDKAARYIDELRAHDPYGLVTESISHEAYSAKPVHSYWDDVFCLRGLQLAAQMAPTEARKRELEAQAVSFERALKTSMRKTMAEHHIDYVPASAELGDFDPTSTAIAISPLNLTSLMPAEALKRTYDLYFENLEKPREDYTPYEMRIIGALVRMGDRERALQLIDRFMKDRRPAAWNEWAEVVGTDMRKPRFIGDMPHAWVASDFVRSIFDAVSYEREDGTLVVGAGVPARWLPLHVGDIRMHLEGKRAIVDIVDSKGQSRKVIVVSPLDAKKSTTIERLPARVVFE